MFKKIAHAVKPDTRPTKSDVDSKAEGPETSSVEQAPLQDQSSNAGAPKAAEDKGLPVRDPLNESGQLSETGTNVDPPTNGPSAETPPTEPSRTTGAVQATTASPGLASGEKDKAESSKDVLSTQTSIIPNGSEEVNGTGVANTANPAGQTSVSSEIDSKDSSLEETPSSQTGVETAQVDPGINDAEGRLKFA